VHVHALALADEGASVGRHVNDGALGDLPHCLVDVAHLLGELSDVLDGSAVSDDLVADALGPIPVGCEVAQKVLIDDNEFSGEDSEDNNVKKINKSTTNKDLVREELGMVSPTIVNVGCEGLCALVVPQYLRGARGGHWCQQE
jgi:hypothetical protein